MNEAFSFLIYNFNFYFVDRLNQIINKKQQAMGIFDKRISYKPFEYPEVLQFVDAINKSFGYTQK